MTVKDSSVFVDCGVWGENHDQLSGTKHIFTPTRRKATRTRDGRGNPNYKYQIETGQNATTPMTGIYDSIELHRGSYSCRYLDLTGYECWSKVWSHPIHNLVKFQSAGSFSTTKAYNLALTKYLQKIRQAAVQFSGPIFLGEAEETRRMLRRPGEALYDSAKNFLQAVARKKRLNPRAWPNALAGLWLEHSFGWQPLINDVLDAAKAYRRLHQPRQIKISASGIDSGKIYDNGTLPSQLSVSYGPASVSNTYCHLTERADAVATMRFKGALWAQAEMTRWQKYDLFGFTPSEFIPTAWELLPWSFLADYFTNIGDILSSAVTDTSVVKWTNLTMTLQGDTYLTMHIDKPAALAALGTRLIEIKGSPGFYHSRRREVTRYTNSGLYLPSFAWELPGSTKRLLNILALLVQARAVHPQNGPSRPYHPGMYG